MTQLSIITQILPFPTDYPFTLQARKEPDMSFTPVFSSPATPETGRKWYYNVNSKDKETNRA